MIPSTILEKIGKAMIPVLIEVALDNFDEIHRYMEDQAAKTTNRLDDFLVGHVMDWLQDWLTEIHESN